MLDLARDNLTLQDMERFCPDLHAKPHISLFARFVMLNVGLILLLLGTAALVAVVTFIAALIH